MPEPAKAQPEPAARVIAIPIGSYTRTTHGYRCAYCPAVVTNRAAHTRIHDEVMAEVLQELSARISPGSLPVQRT